jgi:hypothetical protein
MLLPSSQKILQSSACETPEPSWKKMPQAAAI